MPRILCYLHSFEPGGVERMALRLCQAWRDDGLDVTLVMGRTEGALRGESAAMPFIRLPGPAFPTRYVETLWMMLWLPGLVRKHRPDLIFCAGNSYTIVAAVLRLVLGPACPPIVAKLSNDLARPDMPWPVRRIYHLWCRIQGRAIGQFVALSAAMRDEAAGFLGVEPGGIAVVADPVLSEAQVVALARAGERSRVRASVGTRRRFLAIGRLAPQKNWPLLLRAFARGADAGDQLVILGEGAQRPRLERMVRSLDLVGRVSLPGHSPHIADWLGRSQIFLLPSRYEGTPAVIVEALAAGLPIVATDCCCSIAGMLAGSPASTIVPANDEAALAAAIAAPRPLGAPGSSPVALHHRVGPSSRAYLRVFGDALGRHAVALRPAPLPLS